MKQLQIVIDGQTVEIGELGSTGLQLSYSLEDPEQFEQKQASMSLSNTLPATPNNARIFNSFHDPNVRDLSGDDRYSNPRPCEILVDGVTILRGKSILQDAGYSRIPEHYNISCYGQNGDWSLDMKDITLWDCLSDSTHTFDVATVEASWSQYDLNETKDYVYAPVRYRQPFGNDDDRVDIYHMRPSISIYWLLHRAFRTFGYSIKSKFLNTANYFRRMVLPWTWGDFYDINGQIIEALKFKAVGKIAPFPAGVVDTSVQLWTGIPTDPVNTKWTITTVPPGYVTNFIGGGGNYRNFFMDETTPPAGFDNLNLYSWDVTTDTMTWRYAPPPALSATIGSNITATFTFNLIAFGSKTNAADLKLMVEVTKTPAGVGVPTVNDYLLAELSILGTGFSTIGNLLTPTACSFTVPGINIGDRLDFRLKHDLGPNGITILSSGWVDTDPGGTTHYELVRSSFTLDHLFVPIGGTVNFKFYDKFRSYMLLDLLRGLIDAFDLEVQTDPISKIVYIEPMNEYRMPDGTPMDGYFSKNRLDWTMKQDLSKVNTVSMYSDTERQFDFQFKQDGSDGGQNIYAARYKSIYLNNNIRSAINNTNSQNGIVAGVPGAARYMFPQRFKKGARQLVNRFFSATMHYKHAAWGNLYGVAPQLITIFPENINDSSASAVTQIFEPKLAFYKGMCDPEFYGGWRWIGDKAAPYGEAMAISFPLPFMFSVNYGFTGEADPVLTYSDQLINGNIAPGLVKNYYLRRLAIMRNGRQLKPWITLSLGEFTDWMHNNKIIINDALYHLIRIENYNPLSDESCQCILWKVESPEQRDLDSIYPSAESVEGSVPAGYLGQFDLRYEKLLLFGTDIPQF